MTIDMKSIHDSDRTLVMGVLNITEDSFSDGGLWLDPANAKAHGEAMMKDGADIIDIGAESTRPGAKRVSEEDEQTRVLGAVDALIPEGAVLSIDTTHASVARMALEHGAQIINDVSGGQLDREVPHVVAEHAESLYIVQHWRGWLAGSAGDVPDANTSVYANGVVNDVYDELMKQVDDVLQAGVSPSQIIIDPGLGFSKPSVEHNFPLMVALERFNATGYPVLIGAWAAKTMRPPPSAPCAPNMERGPCACMTWRKAVTRWRSATRGVLSPTSDTRGGCIRSYALDCVGTATPHITKTLRYAKKGWHGSDSIDWRSRGRQTRCA